jgi:hypothetical protein
MDLLAIDAEGAEAKILRAFDLRSALPHVILFEHVHLEEEELRTILQHLKALRFDLDFEGLDVTCTRDIRCGDEPR